MKRKLDSEFCIVKKRRIYKGKRERELYEFNSSGGASDNEEDINRPIKKMINCLKEEVVTLRPFIRIDIKNVPSYIN
jgi:hypothetical protein